MVAAANLVIGCDCLTHPEPVKVLFAICEKLYCDAAVRPHWACVRQLFAIPEGSASVSDPRLCGHILRFKDEKGRSPAASRGAAKSRMTCFSSPSLHGRRQSKGLGVYPVIPPLTWWCIGSRSPPPHTQLSAKATSPCLARAGSPGDLSPFFPPNQR